MIDREALTSTPATVSPAVKRWTLVATVLGSSLTFIDGTVVNVALPALQSSLQATITDVQWVIEAYALFLGSLILVGGSLGDQLGRRRVFVAGVIVFALASMACGVAGSTQMLIASRAVQGVGAAFLVPGSLAIISATFDDAVERGRAIGTWSGFSAITAAIGPVAGGWLIEHVGWRSVFFLNIPLAAIVIALAIRYVGESRDPARTGRIDWTGAALAVFGLGAIVYALLEWTNADISRVVVTLTLIAGIVSLVALVVVESRVPEPMLPLALFRSRTFSLANIVTLLLYGALAVVFWLVPLELIQVQRYSATETSAAFLPFPVLLFALSRWAGALTGRVGSRLPLTIGPLVVALGFAPFARIDITGRGPYWTTLFPVVLFLGFGMTIIVAPLTTTVMAAVDVRHAGVASGVNNAVSRVAGLIAIAVFGIVLVRTFDAHATRALDRLALPAEARAAIDRELPKLAGAEIAESFELTQRAAARNAIDDSFIAAFRLVMNVAAAVALTAAAAGSLIRQSR